MTRLKGPGCMVRGALITFGFLFLPMAGWFLYRDWQRYWGSAVALLLVSAVFLRLGFDRDEDSWVAMIDELGSETKKK